MPSTTTDTGKFLVRIKPPENMTERRTKGTYMKNKGGTGIEEVQFQLDLLIVSLLNALRNRKAWRISTENQRAEKYDDLVLDFSVLGIINEMKTVCCLPWNDRQHDVTKKNASPSKSVYIYILTKFSACIYGVKNNLTFFGHSIDLKEFFYLF